MKRTISIFLCFMALIGYSRTPNDSIKSRRTVFAEILGVNNNLLGLGKEVRVEIDFGEESGGWQGNNDGRDLIIDENGKPIKFNSMVDAINYMGERGWKFETSYVLTVNNKNVVHWLMSKELNKGESAREGIRQMRDEWRERAENREKGKTKKGKRGNTDSQSYSLDEK